MRWRVQWVKEYRYELANAAILIGSFAVIIGAAAVLASWSLR